MDIESIRNYCLAKEGVEEGFPFGPNTIVFKVKGKIFLLAALDASPLRFNAKCDPDRALELREEHESIIPGFHMNKKHWNTIIVDGSLGNTLIRELIDHSYDLISGTKKKK